MTSFSFTLLIISTIIGSIAIGVSDADVLMRNYGFEPPPTSQPHNSHQNHNHPRHGKKSHSLRHHHYTIVNKENEEEMAESSKVPKVDWKEEGASDSEMLEKLIFRALDNPVGWQHLREMLDKVDADLRGLREQQQNHGEGGDHESVKHNQNHSKSAITKWRFHKIFTELPQSSSNELGINHHPHASFSKAIVAIASAASEEKTEKKAKEVVTNSNSELDKSKSGGDESTSERPLMGNLKPPLSSHYYLLEKSHKKPTAKEEEEKKKGAEEEEERDHYRWGEEKEVSKAGSSSSSSRSNHGNTSSIHSSNHIGRTHLEEEIYQAEHLQSSPFHRKGFPWKRPPNLNTNELHYQNHHAFSTVIKTPTTTPMTHMAHFSKNHHHLFRHRKKHHFHSEFDQQGQSRELGYIT